MFGAAVFVFKYYSIMQSTCYFSSANWTESKKVIVSNLVSIPSVQETFANVKITFRQDGKIYELRIIYV